MKAIEIIREGVYRWETDPRVQFHLSVEPNLSPRKPFSEQQRTTSMDGARGYAGGKGIYTTKNPQYWFSQISYENVGEIPRYVYLVWVTKPSNGSVWAAHQNLSEPSNVVVLEKIMEIPKDWDSPLDVGKLYWLTDKYFKFHKPINISSETITESTKHFYYHVTFTKNLPNIKQNGLEPRMGTLSILAGELRPRVYLFNSLEDVENALSNWLGDNLDENETLALLKIQLPKGIKPRSAAFEYQVFTTIPPENITILSTDIDNFEFPK